MRAKPSDSLLLSTYHQSTPSTWLYKSLQDNFPLSSSSCSPCLCRTTLLTIFYFQKCILFPPAGETVACSGLCLLLCHNDSNLSCRSQFKCPFFSNGFYNFPEQILTTLFPTTLSWHSSLLCSCVYNLPQDQTFQDRNPPFLISSPLHP